jgi:hypothetical protein
MRSYFVSLITITFALHFVWEMAQMFAYQEMARQPWQGTLLTCTLATVGDVLATLLVYSVIALLRRNAAWGLRARWNDCAWASVPGAVIAVAAEKVAAAYGQWSYTDAMPIVPVLDVGLLPLLQLALLIPLTIWGAARFPENLLRG